MTRPHYFGHIYCRYGMAIRPGHFRLIGALIDESPRKPLSLFCSCSDVNLLIDRLKSLNGKCDGLTSYRILNGTRHIVRQVEVIV